MGQEECESCGKRVYLMERLAVENHVFHRTCFKCHSCPVQLKQGSYEFDRVSNQFYCRTHYRDVVRQRTIKRTIDQRNLASPTPEEGPGEKGEEGEPKRKKGTGENGDVVRSKVRTSTSDDSESEVPANRHDDTSGSTETKATPTTATLATPTEISRQESTRIRSGLPSLLKNLAAAKVEDTPENAVQSQTEVATVALKNGPTTAAMGSVSIGLPQQQLSGKPLPGKQLSGQHIVTEKAAEKVKIEEKAGEGKGREVEGGTGDEGGEREKMAPVPVKPPRRRTMKIQQPLPQEEREEAPAKVPGRHQGALFSCYFFLLCGLVLYCLIHGLLFFYSRAVNII